MSKSVQYLCTNCGSSNLQREATAMWNFMTQKWEMTDTHDRTMCGECQDEAVEIEVVVNDDPPARMPDDFPEPNPPEGLPPAPQPDSDNCSRYVVSFPDGENSATIVGPFDSSYAAIEHGKELGMKFIVTNVVRPEDSFY